MHIESSKQRNSLQPFCAPTSWSLDWCDLGLWRWPASGGHKVILSRTSSFFQKIVTSSSFGLFERTDYGWMDKGEKDIFMIHTKRTWTRSSRGIEWNDWSTRTSGSSRKKSAYFCKTGFGTVAFLILTCSQTGVLTPSSSLSFQGSQFSWQ